MLSVKVKANSNDVVDVSSLSLVSRRGSIKLVFSFSETSKKSSFDGLTLLLKRLHIKIDKKKMLL